MKRTGRTHPFAEIMEKVLPHLDGGRRGQVVLPHVWGHIVGEVFARQSCPNAIVKGVLDVSVSNANWLHELRFMKAAIMERLHEVLPEMPITDIRFKVGAVPRAPGPAESEPLPELSAEEQQRIRAQADCIQDEDVRSALEAAMAAHARNKKAGV
jgi:hypothetical protein